MRSAEIRKRFLAYFEKRDHRIVASSSLVPIQDPTLLFINAGMNQFKNVFLGLEKRSYLRATSSQKCVRAGGKHNDLENVGLTARHHTFFEMLGNFSFGDYFKKEAIDFAWELLTEDYGLDPARLSVSIFAGDEDVPRDEEANQHWSRYVNSDRILALPRKDNFWSMGDTGPCGPCSEAHYHQGDHLPCLEEQAGASCLGVACECDRWLEIWNLVFMQFNRDAEGKLEPLPAPSVDTGMGLERIAAVIQGVESNYDTDLFTPLIGAIESVSGRSYGASSSDDVSLRVIADHLRATTFLISDGVMPTNEGRGYVLRKIMRRAMRHGQKLGMEGPFLHQLPATVIDLMQDAYPELVLSAQLVDRVVRSEEERFRRTLATGITLFEQILARSLQKSDKVLDGADAFKLYDTYGMPLDMLHEMAGEHNVAVDTEGFELEMAGQRQRARESWKKTAVVSDKSIYGNLRAKGESRFLGYRATGVDEARVVALIRDGAEVPTIGEGEEGEVFLDKTPFYAEAGGQVGDRGILAGPESVADVLDTQMPVAGLYSHLVRIRKGALAKGQQVLARVDERLRSATAANHTTTHMLHASLREVLGLHVKQSGSLVAPDRLRFDFSHFAPLQPHELEAIERRVNEKIQQDLEVATDEMTIDQALDRGAIAFFGEKYGDRVRVVGIADFSMELCGGTHLRQTGQAGLFVITSESSIASGTRRIEALTGPAALDYVRSLRQIVEGVAIALKAQPEELIATAERQRDELRRRDKEIEHLKLELATQPGRSSASDSALTEIGEVRLWTPEPLKNYDKRQHRQFVDAFKNENQGRSWVAISGAVNNEKVSVIVEVSPDLAERVPADDLMKRIVPVIDGRGGGKPTRAEAGGRFPERLEQLYEEARKAVRKAIEV